MTELIKPSKAKKFYDTHQSQILAYKKGWYAKKTVISSFMKKIQLKGYTKSESNQIINHAIKCKNLIIYLDDVRYDITPDGNSKPLEDLASTHLVGFSRVEVEFCIMVEGCDIIEYDNDSYPPCSTILDLVAIGLSSIFEQEGYLSNFMIKMFSNQLIKAN